MRLRSVARCAIIAFFVCLFGNGKVFDNHFSFVPLLFLFFFPACLTALGGKVFDSHFCLFVWTWQGV